MTTVIRSLQNICINYLADSFEQLSSEDNGNQIVWRVPGLVLPVDVSEKLLYETSKRGKLNDGTLSSFEPEHVCLKNATCTIPDASQITEEGLKTLASHSLLSLDICNSSLTLIDVLKCLESQNWASVKNLRCKDLKWRPLCLQSFSHSSNRFVPRLDSVCCLSLINVGLTNRCVDVISSNAPNLKKLDISNNFNITNISPLQKHAERLQVLIMYCVYQLTEVATVDTLRKLKQLQHLDVSMNERRASRGIFQTSSLLKDPPTNPNLTSLDLCGREAVTEEMLGAFLDAHPTLTFLGLLYNEASGYPMFDVKSPQYRPGIKVAGTSNLDQMAMSLRCYHKSRPSYRIHVVHEMGRMDLSSVKMDNNDIIQSISEVMSIEMSFEDFTIHDTKDCLNCLDRILVYCCVSHIQPDTVKQLLCTCRHLLRKIQQTSSDETYQQQIVEIIHSFESLGID